MLHFVFSFNDNPFGGIKVQVSYSEVTKKCAIRLTVDETAINPTANLPLLDLEQVGKDAAKPMSANDKSAAKGQEYGIRFKVES